MADFLHALEDNDGIITREMLARWPTQCVMYGKSSQELLKDIKAPHWRTQKIGTRRKLRVLVYIGDPDAGKSWGIHHFVAKHFPEEPMYIANWSKPWCAMESYAGQRFVLFDDFAGQLDINLMKNLLDYHPTDVRVLYRGNAPFVPEWIFITSNKEPEQWWPFADAKDVTAIKRRFTQVFRFTGDKEKGYKKETVVNAVPWWRKETREYPWGQQEEQSLLDGTERVDPVPMVLGGVRPQPAAVGPQRPAHPNAAVLQGREDPEFVNVVD